MLPINSGMNDSNPLVSFGFEMNYLTSKLFMRSLIIFGRISEYAVFEPYYESSTMGGRPNRIGLKVSYVDAAQVSITELEFAPRFFEVVLDGGMREDGYMNRLVLSTKRITKLFRHIHTMKLTAFNIVFARNSMQMIARYASGMQVDRLVAEVDMQPSHILSDVDAPGSTSPLVFSLSASYLSSLLNLLPESQQHWLVCISRDSAGLIWMTNNPSVGCLESASIVELPLDSVELTRNNSFVSLNPTSVNSNLTFPINEVRSICALCVEESMGSERRIDGRFSTHKHFSPGTAVLRISTAFDQLGFRADLWYTGCIAPPFFGSGAEDVLSVDEIDNDIIPDQDLVEAFIIDSTIS